MLELIKDKWVFRDGMLNQAAQIETDRQSLPLSEEQVRSCRAEISQLRSQLDLFEKYLDTVPTGSNEGQQGFENLLFSFASVARQMQYLERRLKAISAEGVKEHTSYIEKAEKLEAEAKELELQVKSQKEYNNLLENFKLLDLEDQRKVFDALKNVNRSDSEPLRPETSPPPGD